MTSFRSALCRFSRKLTRVSTEYGQSKEVFPETNSEQASLGATLDAQIRDDEVLVTCNSVADHNFKGQLESARMSMDAHIADLWASLREATSACDSVRAKEILSLLIMWKQAQELVGEANNLLTGHKPVPVYSASSWFLHDCFRYLMQQEGEVIHFVTGSQLGRILTLDRMVTFKMSLQTTASVVGDTASTHEALMKMHGFGHSLHAYFHSHPGNGPEATHPSPIDLEYQARQEKGGYPVIGIIFSRDGYFSPFSIGRTFRLNIFGKGAKQINERVYRLITND